MVDIEYLMISNELQILLLIFAYCMQEKDCIFELTAFKQMSVVCSSTYCRTHLVCLTAARQIASVYSLINSSIKQFSFTCSKVF